MKYIYTILFTFACSQLIYAQTTYIDSLNKQLIQTAQDTNRVFLLISLASSYEFFNADTSVALINEALTLTRKLNFIAGEIFGLSQQAEILHYKGEFPKALEAGLTAVQLSRKYNYPEIEANSLTYIATIYKELGEYRQALDYLFQSKKIYEQITGKLKADEFPSYVLANIGVAYEKLNMIDSALYFEKLALNYPLKMTPQLEAYILVRLGIIDSRQKKYKNALSSFRQVLYITDTSKDLLNRNEALFEIAKIFDQHDNIDSAISYALLALTNAVPSQRTGLLDASDLLAKLYKMQGNSDSAFYYQKMAINVRDNLFGLDKFHKLQLLALTEQERVHKLSEEQAQSKTRFQLLALLFSVAVFLLIAFILWRSNKQQKKANHLLNEKNLEIETQSESLRSTLSDLKSTQSQLIQSEKMASLGELTAGIAHEIQNPLNFVNNFSDVNKELLHELKAEADKGNIEDVKAIADDVIENEEKINHHGKRADAIVKGMLQHSRQSSGKKEPTDINALADEYLRLSYHGMRAKDKSFNAEMKTDFDESLGKINIIPQDIGRVLLNLFNNAFYAVNEQKKQNSISYQPTVVVGTQECDGKIQITVRDNGNGIPQKNSDKIFQPFFTTKPTGQGTGLGLSLSYDIIKAHGGEIKVDSKEGKGSEFVIELPNKQS